MTDTIKRTLNFPDCSNYLFPPTSQSIRQNYYIMKYKQNKQNKQSDSSSITSKSPTQTTMTTKQNNLNSSLTSEIQETTNMSSSLTTVAATTSSNPRTSVTTSSNPVTVVTTTSPNTTSPTSNLSFTIQSSTSPSSSSSPYKRKCHNLQEIISTPSKRTILNFNSIIFTRYLHPGILTAFARTDYDRKRPAFTKTAEDNQDLLKRASVDYVSCQLKEGSTDDEEYKVGMDKYPNGISQTIFEQYFFYPDNHSQSIEEKFALNLAKVRNALLSLTTCL